MATPGTATAESLLRAAGTERKTAADGTPLGTAGAHLPQGAVSNQQPPVPPISEAALQAILQRIARTNDDVLELPRMGIGDEAAKAIADALRTNTSIEMLVLAFNNIGDIGAKALFSALEVNNSIVALILGGNRIGNEGAKALIQMLDKREKRFVVFVLGGNCFDDDHAKLIFQSLIRRHDDVIRSTLQAVRQRIAPGFHEQYQKPGLDGDVLARKFAQDPSLFLVPNPNDLERAVMAAPYDQLSEFHDFGHYSRRPTMDCRKMAEDLLVAHYRSVSSAADTDRKSLADSASHRAAGAQAARKSNFRVACIDAGDFFPTVVNIVKLALAGERGRHIQVDLIDEFLFGDHELFVKGYSHITAVFEFMALLHRMGIHVILDKEKDDETDEFVNGIRDIMSHMHGVNYVCSDSPTAPKGEMLAIEDCGFVMLTHCFKKVENPLARVSIALYDSMAAYVQALRTSKISPDAILDIHSSRTDEYLRGLKDYVNEGTALFLLYQIHGCFAGPKAAAASAAGVAATDAAAAGAAGASTAGGSAATDAGAAAKTAAANAVETSGNAAKAKDTDYGFEIHLEFKVKRGGQWIDSQPTSIFRTSFDEERKYQMEIACSLAARYATFVNPFASPQPAAGRPMPQGALAANIATPTAAPAGPAAVASAAPAAPLTPQFEAGRSVSVGGTAAALAPVVVPDLVAADRASATNASNAPNASKASATAKR